VTPELRDQFLDRAQEIGMRPAAREFGISPSAAAGLTYRRRNRRDPATASAPRVRLYTTKVYAEIDDEMRCQIDALATRDGISRARVVRELLEWALEEFGDAECA